MNWQQVQMRLYQQGWSPEVVVEATERAREQQRRDEARRCEGVGIFQLKPEVFAYRASGRALMHPEDAQAYHAEQIGQLFRDAGFEVTASSDQTERSIDPSTSGEGTR